jgi:hypothetical protein
MMRTKTRNDSANSMYKYFRFCNEQYSLPRFVPISGGDFFDGVSQICNAECMTGFLCFVQLYTYVLRYREECLRSPQLQGS